MHLTRFLAQDFLHSKPNRICSLATGLSEPLKRLRGLHILTLRRFQAPSCKHFRQTTYTNTSNIDFYRTFDAFLKVFGPRTSPLAAIPHWLVCNRSSQNPQNRCRGAHILTLRRFQTPPCKHFRQTTYTNTSNIDFCRTYTAFVKVLAQDFPRSTPNRTCSFAPGTPEHSKTLKSGSHFQLTAFPGSILLAFSANDLHKHFQHRFF